MFAECLRATSVSSALTLRAGSLAFVRAWLTSSRARSSSGSSLSLPFVPRPGSPGLTAQQATLASTRVRGKRIRCIGGPPGCGSAFGRVAEDHGEEGQAALVAGDADADLAEPLA